MTNDTLTISRELRALLAAPVVEASNKCGRCGASTVEGCNYLGCYFLESGNGAPAVERQEPVVIDLDAVDWETIQQAADESNWMPNEYMRNEWVADVCNFLKYGRADTSPPTPVAVEIDERAEFEKWVIKELPGIMIDIAPVMKFYKGDDGPRLDDMWSSWKARACLDKVKELNQ